MENSKIIESAELMYEFDFEKYVSKFSEDEINMALENAKMYCDEDYAACAFLGFLDGISFNKSIVNK